MRRGIIFAFLAVMAISVWADSPLTSTRFWKIYNTSEESTTFPLYQAVDNNGWGEVVMEILCSSQLSVEKKLCVVNYLGWNINGQEHYKDLVAYYTAKKGFADKRAAFRDMDGQMLAVFAYVKAMDDYFDVKEAKRLSAEAVRRAPKSRAVAMTDALIGAQIAMDSNWGKVYECCHEVEIDTSLDNDFCDPAIVAIMEYINEYAKY